MDHLQHPVPVDFLGLELGQRPRNVAELKVQQQGEDLAPLQRFGERARLEQKPGRVDIFRGNAHDAEVGVRQLPAKRLSPALPGSDVSVRHPGANITQHKRKPGMHGTSQSSTALTAPADEKTHPIPSMPRVAGQGYAATMPLSRMLTAPTQADRGHAPRVSAVKFDLSS